jgi:hypothetical protein
MFNFDKVQEKFQKVCVKDKKFLILIFGSLSMKEINSAKIIGPKDDCQVSFSIAKEAGYDCLCIIETDEKLSIVFSIIRDNAREKIEDSYRKIFAEGLLLGKGG